MANALPFALGTFVDDTSDTSEAWTALLGTEYKIGEREYRLVRLNVANGFVAGKKLFKWTASTGRLNYDVEPTTAGTDQVCGIGAAELGAQTVEDNALFLVQIYGKATVINGDTGANFVVDEAVIPDGDADKGKAAGSGAYTDDGVDFAISLATNTTTDADVDVLIHRKLV